MLYYTLLGAEVKKPYFMGQKSFGKGYGPGADGIYGRKTQGAINALRKRWPNEAPARQRNFNKSVAALIKYLETKEKEVVAGKKAQQIADAAQGGGREAAARTAPAAAGAGSPMGRGPGTTGMPAPMAESKSPLKPLRIKHYNDRNKRLFEHLIKKAK